MAIALQQDEQLTQRRQRVLDLQRRAYGPMHVPQPDGSTLRLCFVARLQRAYERINATPADQRAPMLAKVKQIEQEAAEEQALYLGMLEGYRNLCSWSNVEMDIPVYLCNCEVCAAYEPPTVHFETVAMVSSVATE